MANEIQLITLSAAPQHGYYKLTFQSEETGEIAYDANAATIQAALEALATIGSGNVSVTVDGLVITIEFIGSLANTDVTAITVSANTMGRNTVETLSLNGIATSGSVSAKESAAGTYGSLAYSADNTEIENVLETRGYPTELVSSGAPISSGTVTITTPANVTLALEDGGSFTNVDSEPLTLTYTKTQSYAAVTATPSTEQEGAPEPTMIVAAPSGLSLTAKIFARNSDVVIETVTLTELTNAKCFYSGEVTEGETGWHKVAVFSGATPIGGYVIYLTDDAVEHYAQEYCGIEDPEGLLSTVGPTVSSIAASVASALQTAHGEGAWTTANVSALATASQLGSSSAQLLSGINDLKATGSALLATAGAILDDTGTSGVVVANAAKTGYSLAATGLDSISVSDPGAPSNWTTLPKIINGVLRFFWKKTEKNATTGEIKAYADNGSTVNATMSYTSSTTLETKGPAA